MYPTDDSAPPAFARLEALFERRLNRVEQLQDFISLFGQRQQHAAELADLADASAETRRLFDAVQERVRDFRRRLLPMARTELAASERHQQSALNLLEALLEREEQQLERRNPPIVLQEMTANNPQKAKGVTLQLPETTPQRTRPPQSDASVARMLLSDYTKSPFARRTRPPPAELQFVDFEAAAITQPLMDSIPSYMRRREKLADLQLFWDSQIVRCFTQKYALVHKRREAVRGAQLTQWQLYQQQEEYFPGQLFITQGDLATQMGKLLCQKTKNRLAMLKHCKMLRERLHRSTVCYVWPN